MLYFKHCCIMRTPVSRIYWKNAEQNCNDLALVIIFQCMNYLLAITGHYINDVYNIKDKTWLSYNDSQVKFTNIQEVTSRRDRSGYVFFYMDKSVFCLLFTQSTLLFQWWSPGHENCYSPVYLIISFYTS